MTSNFYGSNIQSDKLFDFINIDQDREFLKSAHQCISNCELWSWLNTYIPPPNTGFMFSDAPEMKQIKELMAENPINSNHSGSSFGLIMRQMEYIAKNGYDHFKIIYNYN